MSEKNIKPITKEFLDVAYAILEPGTMNLMKSLEKELGFGMEFKEMQDLIESIKLVQTFFVADPAKVPMWFTTKNPHLGECKPIELFFRGRGHKVLSFIQNSLDENKLDC